MGSILFLCINENFENHLEELRKKIISVEEAREIQRNVQFHENSILDHCPKNLARVSCHRKNNYHFLVHIPKTFLEENHTSGPFVFELIRSNKGNCAPLSQLYELDII